VPTNLDSLDSKEFRWASELDALARYAYSVNRIRRQGELWCLRSSSGMVLGWDPDADPVCPVWPHEKFALEGAAEEWADSFAESIPLTTWLEVTTPLLESRRIAVGVFMTADHWVHVRPSTFAKHLRAKAQKRYALPREKVWPRAAALRTP
jgi:hypothetical protein